MIYEIGDIVTLDDHNDTKLYYKVLDTFENKQPRKLMALNPQFEPIYLQSKKELTYTASKPSDWKHITFTIYNRGELPKYFKVIRKIKELDQRFLERKQA